MDPNTFKTKIEPLVKIKPIKGAGLLYDANPQVTPIHEPKPCDECDRMVKGRTVIYFIKDLDKKPYWTKKCSGCKTRFGKISRKDII